MRSVNVRFRSGLDLAEDQDVAFPESKSWPRWMGSGRYFASWLLAIFTNK